jgi:hypothetical protein
MNCTQEDPIQRPLRVFICHTAQDTPMVENLLQTLNQWGVETWSTAKNVYPGQKNSATSAQAIRESDLFIACLSQATSTEAGAWNSEINQGLDLATTQPEGHIYFIAARLEACQMPQRLQEWQPVDLYEEQSFWIDKVFKSFQLRAVQVGANQPVYSQPLSPSVPALSKKGLLVSPMQNFSLTFKNRELERSTIERYIKNDFCIQIYAPAGLGKTVLMREIQMTMTQQGWHSLWIDFANEQNFCVADKQQFLLEIIRQMKVTPSPDPLMREDQLLFLIGREFASYDHLLILLDNADRCDHRFLEWIGTFFFKSLSEWGTPIIISSSQQRILEWSGYGKSCSFHEMSLSSFTDPLVLYDILKDVAERYGNIPMQRRMKTPEWRTDMDTMINGLRKITQDHPLAIERVLRYTMEREGLIRPTFFIDNQQDIVLHCISPIIGERILPTVDRSVREAFRSLCIFRYIWAGLIKKMTNKTSSLWESFYASGRGWGMWWSLLQDSHLVVDIDARLFYPISPIIRQLINHVLRYEDPEWYRLRHQFARQEYESVVASSQVAMIQRAAALVESWYHIAQDDTLPNKEHLVKEKLTTFMADTLDQSNEHIEVAIQMHRWLRSDKELREELAHLSLELPDWLVEKVEQYREEWKGRLYE